MFKRLFSLEWKSFFRSASLGKSIGLKILMGFLGLYFTVAFLMFGIGLYPIITEHFPGEQPLYLVNRFVLVWLVMELVYRFLLQNLPIMDIKPLMLLPIKKEKVVNFVLLKSLYSFFNFLPLLIIVPFGIYNIYKQTFSTVAILAWTISMIGLTLSVNYANFIIKKNFTDNIKALIPVVGSIAIIGLLDYFKVFESSVWFGKGLNAILEFPLLASIPVLIFLFFYKWNQKDLKNKFYLDATLKEQVKDANTKEFLWTDRFGELAPYLQLDLKMIWRNKRPKTTIYISILFLAYGLIFYPNETYQDMPAFYVFIGIFITGIFMINFGQFIPAWDAGYYPLMMAQNIPLKKYLTAKAGLISFSVVVLAILSTPYLYFGWKILVINMVCAVYNIGINIPILLYAGSFNRKKIDLDKSPFLNYQGTGATQWVVSLPLMVVPILIFWIFNKFLSFESALTVLFVLGILGLILRNRAIGFIAQRYKKQKYAMIEGFKQSGQ
ncbi:hypothetical protein JM83_1237 [Gillisia sp. Hel_I_86]|uniref:DUF5687 family protein n=1 Tax=Gillisia sp. Hel_I_86 TaxID=1249981 RepID=UPI001199D73E|nr:DUF5687 family protein [Gillisia sp. Hel_I_86]TVZ26283.1 hypothetical protein JM83_1237 [Gillisia sp. Hel_I_86]